MEPAGETALRGLGEGYERVGKAGRHLSDPNEQREGLSLAEERFERARQKMTRLLGSVAFLVTYLVPLPPERQVLAAVFAFVIVYGSGMSPVTTTVRFGAVSIVAGVPSMVQLVGLT